MRLFIIVFAAFICSINSFSASIGAATFTETMQVDHSAIDKRVSKGHEPTTAQQPRALLNQTDVMKLK